MISQTLRVWLICLNDLTDATRLLFRLSERSDRRYASV